MGGEARTLADELLLELVEELKSELVFWGKCFLSDDRLHRRGVAADSVLCVLQTPCSYTR